MKRIFKLFFVFFTLFGITQSMAQDPHFSQFYANPMYLNPAYAGGNFCPRWIINYRNQWPALPGDYVTYNSSFDFGLREIHGGLGLIALHDNAGSGVMTTNKVSLLYAYHANLTSTTTLSAGFQFSYFQRRLSQDHAFGDEIDELYGFIYPTSEDIVNNPSSKNFPDFSAGLLGYSDNLFFGFAAHHLTQPNQGFISESQLPTKFTIHAGGNFPVSRYRNLVTTISPNFLYQKQQDFQQFNYGIYVNRGPVVGGLWARNSLNNFDSFILMLGLVQESFKFGYSYDITLSELKLSNTLGAHELSFTLFLPCRAKGKSFNTISCPQF